MKVYRTVRLLTETALNIIAHNGRCTDIDCNLCPLHIDMCNIATMKLLDPNKRIRRTKNKGITDRIIDINDSICPTFFNI